MPPHAFRRAAVRRAIALGAVTALTCTLAVSATTAATAAVVPDPISTSVDDAALSLSPIRSYARSVCGWRPDSSAATLMT